MNSKLLDIKSAQLTSCTGKRKRLRLKVRRINCFSRLCYQICLRLSPLGMTAVMATPGCVTSDEKPVEQIKPVYVLNKGEVVEHPNPLPFQTDVSLSDLTQRQMTPRLGYRLWDLNHDGLVDMLDVMDSEGKVSTRLYDFNQDGKVDLQKELSP